MGGGRLPGDLPADASLPAPGARPAGVGQSDRPAAWMAVGRRPQPSALVARAGRAGRAGRSAVRHGAAPADSPRIPVLFSRAAPARDDEARPYVGDRGTG